MGVRDDDPTLMGSTQGSHRGEPRTGAPRSAGRSGIDAPWPDRSHVGGGRYRLDDVIASGGAAIVWRGFDEHLARPVAVKLLHPHHAGDATVVERFQREARAAAGLSHPNVVRIYDTGREDRIVWLVMELVEGPSLRDVLLRREPLDAVVVAAFGEQVARALAAAHDKGIVHRDIKPANVLIAIDGTVKVTDFGIAKALSGVDETLTNPGTVMGTAAYVAPEQLEGVDIDARADVYALGVVMYEALVGRPAFSGDTPAATAAMRLSYELLPARRARPDVPEELDEVVTRATRRDRGARYADGRAFADALIPLLSSRPSLLTARLLPGSAALSELHEDELLDAATGAFARPGDVRRMIGAALAGAALTAAVLVAGAVVRDAVPEAPASVGVVWPVADVRVLDPRDPTLTRDAELALAAVDGDVQTVWSPATWSSVDLDGTEGVGLLLDLGDPREVRGITVRLVRGGADVALYASDEEPVLATEGPVTTSLGAPLTVQRGVRSLQRFEFAPLEARYWVVWVTGVSPSPTGTFSLELADVSVLGPG
jgi:eukaryotic-like serine/threonine-protein kinase